MYHFHSGGTARTETLGANTATSRATTVTAHASNNTKGSWVDFASVTRFTYEQLWIALTNNSGATDYLIDIGVKVSGNYYVIAEDIRNDGPGRKGQNAGGQVVQLPIHVPAGTQLAVRCQCRFGGNTIEAQITGFSHGINGAPGYSRMVRLNATSNSQGVAVDPGGTINTKVRTELVASTSYAVAAVFLRIGPNNDVARGLTGGWLFDLEMGGSGSEQVLIANFPMNWESTMDLVMPDHLPILPCYSPSGSRFSVNAQCSGNTAGDRTFDVMLYGFLP